MNLKEAREILKNHKGKHHDYVRALEGCSECEQAEAYLAHHEQTRPLIEALEKIRRGKMPEDMDNYIIMAARLSGIAQRALAEYKASVGEGQNG